MERLTRVIEDFRQNRDKKAILQREIKSEQAKGNFQYPLTPEIYHSWQEAVRRGIEVTLADPMLNDEPIVTAPKENSHPLLHTLFR